MNMGLLLGLSGGATSGGGGGGGPTVSSFLGQVATRSFTPHSQSTDLQGMCRTAHVARTAITSLQVLYPAWYVPTTAEVASTQNITYKVGLEYPAGTVTPIQWAASNTKVATAGSDTGLSDALSISIPSGARFWLRVYATVSSGGVVRTELSAGSPKDTGNGEACAFGASTTDKAHVNTAITDTGESAAIYPLAIVATTTKPSFFLVGGSRTIGQAGTPDANGDTGEFARSIGPSYPYINTGAPGLDIVEWINSNTRQLALSAYCSHIYNGLGFNDITTDTVAQFQGNIATLWKFFPSKPIIQGTISPFTTSSDSWATLGNQTLDASSTRISSVNTWLRTLPSPIAALVDIASTTESGSTGKWNSPGYTADGVHPTDAGYTATVTAGVIVPDTLAALSVTTQPWSPAQIASQVTAWFDASSPLALADGSSWESRLGAGILTQATGGSRPAATTINSLQAYNYAGIKFQTGNATLKALTNNKGQISIAMVAKADAGVTSAPIFMSTDGGATSTRNNMGIIAGATSIRSRRLNADSSVTATATATISNQVPYVQAGIYNPAASAMSNFVNGTADGTNTYAASGNWPSADSLNVQVGSGDGATTTVSIAEFVITNSVLSTNDRQKLEGYLAWKWGTVSSLAVGHPYKSVAP
jgi:hypothetical protein